MNIPKIDLRTFIIQLAQGALVGLGEEKDPEVNAKRKNLPLASHHIGVLEMLEEKTKNNRSDEESKLLEAVLKDLKEKLETC